MNDKVWAELGSGIGSLDKVVRQPSGTTAKAVSSFVAQLVVPAFTQVGWDAKPDGCRTPMCCTRTSELRRFRWSCVGGRTRRPVSTSW